MDPRMTFPAAFFFAFLAVAPLGAAPADRVIAGVVADQTGGLLPDAVVELRTPSGRLIQEARTARDGSFRFENPAGDTFVIEVSMAGFSRLRRSDVRVMSGSIVTLQLTLSLSLETDVTVTGKRAFDLRDLADGENLIGVAHSATQGVVSGRQIDQRPIMRAGEVLEAVPGVIISQHSGEGKANQYYLRGFNLDHGTDFATTVAGVPVNMPTHAHGHGYSDLNFLIPELVSGVQFNKGPYAADEGDFSTAGASHVRYANTLDAPALRVSFGGDGWRRAFAAASPRIGGGHLLTAIEVGSNDGPWSRPDDYGKINGVLRYSRGGVRNAFSVTAMAYSADWNATDQIPARAINGGLLGRFDAIDNTLGGATARYSLSSDWQRASTAGMTRATAYALRYRLNLFSNFTYFLDDPVNGDQFEQADRRYVVGGRITHRISTRIGDRPAELLVGLDTRHDNIGTIGLYHTVGRVREAVTREDAVRQTSMGSFAQHDLQWTPWLRSTIGVRADRFQFNVAAGNPLNSGKESDTLVSPKLAAIIGPWKSTELYVNWGNGFHSNDARGATITVDPNSGMPAERVTPLVRARGEEIGVRTMPFKRLRATLALWRLGLDSELLFVGDAGTTEAGRPSLRRGFEVSASYSLPRWVSLDADVSISRARFRDDHQEGNRIPGAVERVIAAGLTVEDAGPMFGSTRIRYFGSRDLLENGSARSAPTTLVNLQAGARLSSRIRLIADVFNLFDRRVSDIDYFYASRLAGEPAGGVEDVHLHPALPRSVRIGLSITP
jgi:hypothetical protein